jgi:hypothetical protein
MVGKRSTKPLRLAGFAQLVYRILPVFWAKMVTRDAISQTGSKRAAFPDIGDGGRHEGRAVEGALR